MEPFNVNIDNQGQVWQNLYGDIRETYVKRLVFKINDKVRISRWKGRFDKGYENDWSMEIFIIYKILTRNPFVYMQAMVTEWYRHRIVAGFVTSSSPVPLKTRRVGQRCTLNLSRAEMSSRWCGVVVRRGGVPAQVSSTSLDHGSKLRGPSPKALVQLNSIEESPFVADPQAASQVFYVYSDIVRPVVVGHVKAPLLRVVRISGDVVSAQCDRPHYVPVIRQNFHTIEIEIRLNSGDLLRFERGQGDSSAFPYAAVAINTQYIKE
ncbi:uncharacterized transposon-derived protein F54H12.3 [Trichonephila clavipes]|nr:uncharacterized transposon-derived protein F54H12.3 [Trichonephila clavipes]